MVLPCSMPYSDVESPRANSHQKDCSPSYGPVKTIQTPILLSSQPQGPSSRRTGEEDDVSMPAAKQPRLNTVGESSGSGVSSGTIIHLHEITAHARPGMSVRVLGVLEELDTYTGCAVLTHPQRDAALAINLTQALEGARRAFHIGDLLQIVGELNASSAADPGSTGETLVLYARVALVVNGMNVELYERTVDARRAFEDEVCGTFDGGRA